MTSSGHEAAIQPNAIAPDIRTTESAPSLVEYKSLQDDFNNKAKREGNKVHSYESLEASRNFVMVLMEHVPEYKQIEMAASALAEEMALQKSIRIRDYSSAEMTDKMRRFILVFMPITLAVFLVLLILLTIGAAAWKWNVDSHLFNTIATMLGTSFVATTAAIAYHFFPKDGK